MGRAVFRRACLGLDLETSTITAATSRKNNWGSCSSSQLPGHLVLRANGGQTVDPTAVVRLALGHPVIPYFHFTLYGLQTVAGP